ncbi:hypothetical protein BGY98DRAFT_995863, partial [Russula aff. rugulosa BPL654]
MAMRRGYLVNAAACGEPASAPTARYAYIREIGYLSTVPVHKNGYLVQKLKAFPVISQCRERRRLFVNVFLFVFDFSDTFPPNLLVLLGEFLNHFQKARLCILDGGPRLWHLLLSWIKAGADAAPHQEPLYMYRPNCPNCPIPTVTAYNFNPSTQIIEHILPPRSSH